MRRWVLMEERMRPQCSSAFDGFAGYRGNVTRIVTALLPSVFLFVWPAAFCSVLDFGRHWEGTVTLHDEPRARLDIAGPAELPLQAVALFFIYHAGVAAVACHKSGFRPRTRSPTTISKSSSPSLSDGVSL
jgi:hypothetical protein